MKLTVDHATYEQRVTIRLINVRSKAYEMVSLI